jgi:hypothetical protein
MEPWGARKGQKGGLAMAPGARKGRPRELRKTQRRKKRKEKKGLPFPFLESRSGSHFLYIFQVISFLINILKINPNKAIGKMSWFLDCGLDLQIPILICFFLKIDNF